MINTTLNEILKHKPEEELWRKLLKHLGKTHFRKTKADDEPLPLVKILESNGLSDAIWCLRTLGTATFHNALTYTQNNTNTEQVKPGIIPIEMLDDDALLAELEGIEGVSYITELRHVRPYAERRAAEKIAEQVPCRDFERFKPLFEAAQHDLNRGTRITRLIKDTAGFWKANIRAGEFFILYGQIVYIAEVGESFKAPNGLTDARLRVIYSNGTESDLLLLSLQRALYKDKTSRAVEVNANLD